ncbi:MAG: PIN domain-containing protein [Candidatus Bathyarchaeia archaeon]
MGQKPAEIIKVAEEGKVEIAVSKKIAVEISQVSNYSKLRIVYLVAGLSHKDLVEAVLKVPKFVEVPKRVIVVLEYPADDKFIECTMVAGADYVVSSDRRLPEIGGYKRAWALSVEFVSVLESK